MSVPAPQFKGAGQAYWKKTVTAFGNTASSNHTSSYAFRKKTYAKGKYTSKAGFITPTAYSSVASYCTSSQYSWWTKSPYVVHYHGDEMGFGYLGGSESGFMFFNSTLNYLNTWPGYSTEPRTEAVTKARASANKGDFNLLVSVAEARETATSIASLVAGAATILLGIKKRSPRLITTGILMVTSGSTSGRYGNHRTAYLKTPTRVGSDGWLNYQYGWKPLLSDIYALLELFTSQLAKAGHHFSTIGNGSGSFSGVFPDPLNSKYYQIFENIDIVVYNARAKLYWRVNDPYVHLASGLGLTNPALLFWELVPFSFVVDWLVPIGTFLESLSAPIGLTYTGGYVTEHAERRSAVAYAGAYPMTLGTIDYPSRGERRALAVTRTPYPTIPSGGVYIRNPFSSTHAASASALLRNLRK